MSLKMPTYLPEIRIYKNLGHCFELGLDTPANGWISDALSFLKRNSEK